MLQPIPRGPLLIPSAIGFAILMVVATLVVTRPGGSSLPANHLPPTTSPSPRSAGLCIERTVTRVIDGDTLEVEGGLRIRLVLVDAPELSETPGPASRDYLTSLCLGSRALLDEDDLQIGEDPYGRILAVVICGRTNANAALIASGHADTYRQFCAGSEFGGEAWTGCSSPPPPGDCDPAYPDVGIPPRRPTWTARRSPTGTSRSSPRIPTAPTGTAMGSAARRRACRGLSPSLGARGPNTKVVREIPSRV